MRSVFMRISTIVEILARLLAVTGGIVLVALTLMTLISVTGRSLISLGLRPISGDFEIVEGGMAFAVFAFFPWCHLNRKNITVDILTRYWPAGANRIIDFVTDTLMLTVAILIAWRHWDGMWDKIAYGETSFILEYPIWWGYAGAMLGAAVFVFVSLYCFVRSIWLFFDPHIEDSLAELSR